MSDSGDDENDAPSYVSDFVYLDMDQVKSISARMGGGFIKEIVEGDEEMAEVSTNITTRLMASIFGVGSAGAEGQVTATSGVSSHEESVKGLHHYHFNLLENRLEDAEGEWFHDLGDISLSASIAGDGFREESRSEGVWGDISEGHIIRVNGDLEVSDMSTSLDFLKGILTTMYDSEIRETLEVLKDDSSDVDEAFDEGSPLADMDDEQRQEHLLTFFEYLSKVVPKEYEEMIFAELFPISNDRDHKVRLTIDEDKLEDEPIELMTNYENSRIPDCTLVERVKTVTSDESIDMRSGLNNVGMMHHLIDELAEDMGLKVTYPSISVKPIAIFR